jgi:hypothetical protein
MIEIENTIDLYNIICNKINEIIPVNWNKAFLYVEISEGIEVLRLYYYQNNNGNIYSLEMKTKHSLLNIKKFEELQNELYDDVRCLWKEFANHKKQVWTNMTLEMSNIGELNINYDYSELNGNEIDVLNRKISWEHKYLNLVLK